MSFKFTSHLLLVDAVSLPAVEGDVQTVDNKTLFNSIDFSHADAEDMGDLFVFGSCFLILPFIASQEDQGIEDFPAPFRMGLYFVYHCKAKYYDYFLTKLKMKLAMTKGDLMMNRKAAVLALVAAAVLLAGCVTTPHTYTDKKLVKLSVPACV